MSNAYANGDHLICQSAKEIAQAIFNSPENVYAREKYRRFQNYFSRVRAIANDYISNLKQELEGVKKLRRKHAWTKCGDKNTWTMTKDLDLYTENPVACIAGGFMGFGGIPHPTEDGQQIFLHKDYGSGDNVLIICAGPSDEQICIDVSLISPSNKISENDLSFFRHFRYRKNNEKVVLSDGRIEWDFKEFNNYPELSNDTAMVKDEDEYVYNIQKKMGCLAFQKIKEKVSISTISRTLSKESQEGEKPSSRSTKI